MRPLRSQSHLRFPLTSYIGSEGAVRVLRVLFAHAGVLSVSQLARDSGLTPKGTRQTIATLLRNKLLKRFGQSRSQLFSIDYQNPLANGLKELFDIERARWESVLKELRQILTTNEDVEAAWFYGSVARAEDTQDSDFDIVVLATDGRVDSTTEAVRNALQKVEDRLYVTCSVVGLSSSDAMRLSEGDAWWGNVIRDAKVLKGVDPEQYLARIRNSLP